MLKKIIKGGGKRPRREGDDERIKCMDYGACYDSECSDGNLSSGISEDSIYDPDDQEKINKFMAFFLEFDSTPLINIKDFLKNRDTLSISLTIPDYECIKIKKTKDKKYFNINNTNIYIYKYLNRGAYGIIFIAIDILNKKKYILKFMKTSTEEISVMEEISSFVTTYKYPHFVILYEKSLCSSINDQVIDEISHISPELEKFINGYDTDFNNYIEKSDKDGINNFIDDNGKYSLLIMEMFDGTVYDLYKQSLDIIQWKSILAQMYVSILMLHKCINYYHKDAHNNNFFYKRVVNNNNKYLHYLINGIDIYIKITEYLIVIGDYGKCEKIQVDQPSDSYSICDYMAINNIFINVLKETINESFKSTLITLKDNELIKFLIEETDIFYTSLPSDGEVINKEPYIISDDISTYEVITYDGGKTNKKNIIYNGNKRLVKKDSDKKKYIIYKKSKVYLSEIKGKYKYYNK